MKIQDFHRQKSHLTVEHFSLKEKKKKQSSAAKECATYSRKTEKNKQTRNTLLALKQHSVTPTESEMRYHFPPPGPHSLLGKLNV